MNCWAHAEDAARYDKAKKLARLIIEWRISGEEAKRMTGEQWRKLSIAAAVPNPSSPTRELTLDLVELARNQVARININEQVTVKLTPQGLATLISSLESTPVIGKKPDYAREYLDVCHPGWKEGQFKAELWKLMNIFGPTMYMGQTAIQFEKNEINIPVAAKSF